MKKSENFNLLNDLLLQPNGLTVEMLAGILAKGSGSDIDLADFYLQSIYSESWSIEEGIIKESSFGIDSGFGVRVVSREKTGFSYSNEIGLPALQDGFKTALEIVKNAQEGAVPNLKPVVCHSLYSSDDPLSSLSQKDKVSLLHEIDREARAQDNRVRQVTATLSGNHELVLIVDREGFVATDVRPLVRLNVSVVVEENGKYEKAYAGGGGRSTYQQFLGDSKLGLSKGLFYAREAVRTAILNLNAVSAPAGVMPVILGAGWPGVLLHEAIGHGLEGDSIRKKSSIFTGHFGEQIASPLCTIVDNGALDGFKRGSLNVDDEGTLTQNTVLIEKGVLKNCMQDKLNSRLMNTKSTGNGRRESYAHIPIPRMTNTYMLPGNYKPSEIIESVKKGVYAVNFSGGQVDVASGKFVFSANEAYLIEGGKIQQPIKGATLIGDGLTVLQKISMLGDDLELDSGVGVCGKQGQHIPVGIGQPTVKVDELTVGGTFA